MSMLLWLLFIALGLSQLSVLGQQTEMNGEGVNSFFIKHPSPKIKF